MVNRSYLPGDCDRLAGTVQNNRPFAATERCQTVSLQRELKPGGNPARLFFTASYRSSRNPRPAPRIRYSATDGPIRAGYSITSSARTSSDCGTIRPSAMAVLRLITSSNLVG